jgi:hypothetical protein
LDNEEFSTTSFEVYMKTWPQLKKMFRGAKHVRPVEDSTEDIKALWNKLVIRGGSEGLVIRLDNGKTYKVKPSFSYDLVILAVGSKKGKNWPKKQIGMTLMAFMDKDRVFRTAGHIGTGWTREQSQELFKWAQANKVGEDDEYVWTRPQRVVECVWERSLIREADAYKFVNGKYESVGKKMSGTIQKPKFIRFRTDKSVNPSDLRLEQIPGWTEKQKMAHRVACKFMATSNIRLFLDDMRDPKEYGLHDVFWVKTYKDAIEQLKTGKVSWVSLDNDLGEEKTGYDVAKYIEENVFHGKLKCPEWQIHSANPKGRQNIEMAMNSAERFKKASLSNQILGEDNRVASMYLALELSTTSPHRAVYIFKSPEEYRKACDLLDQGIGYKRPEYDYGKIDSQLQISIPENRHELVENLWAKNGIKDFERFSSEIASLSGQTWSEVI